MILSDYYRLERLPEFAQNRTPRFDCTASTGSYQAFEAMAAKSRVKRFYCYYNGVPDTFSDHARTKADRAITNSQNISSVFIPNLDKPLLGYGDVKGTNDAILFTFAPDYNSMEIFIARGYKSNARALFNHFQNGDLNGEAEAIRGCIK